MPKEIFKQLKNRYGSLRMIQAGLIGGVVILSFVVLLEMSIPVKVETLTPNVSDSNTLMNSETFSEQLEYNSCGFECISSVMRSGLFQASTSVGYKPMAEKTIERIKSQLRLQCIMQLGEEPVAYINIEGTGLRKCGVGDSVKNLFKVIDINKNSVEVSIIGHKVFLRL